MLAPDLLPAGCTKSQVNPPQVTLAEEEATWEQAWALEHTEQVTLGPDKKKLTVLVSLTDGDVDVCLRHLW